MCSLCVHWCVMHMANAREKVWGQDVSFCFPSVYIGPLHHCLWYGKGLFCMTSINRWKGGRSAFSGKEVADTCPLYKNPM